MIEDIIKLMMKLIYEQFNAFIYMNKRDSETESEKKFSKDIAKEPLILSDNTQGTAISRVTR
jgi:hypothetical protein